MRGKLIVSARLITTIVFTVLLCQSASAAPQTWQYSGELSGSSPVTSDFPVGTPVLLTITVDPASQTWVKAAMMVGDSLFTLAAPTPVTYYGESTEEGHVYTAQAELLGPAPGPFSSTLASVFFDADQEPDFGSNPFTAVQILAYGSGDYLFVTRLALVDTPPNSPIEMLAELIKEVVDLNMKAGIANSYDAKLSAASAVLSDSRENDDVAAINGLGAFINAVEAQRDKFLTNTEADRLVAGAQAIIAVLEGK